MNHFWRLFLFHHLGLVSRLCADELVVVHEALGFHMVVIDRLGLAVVSDLRAVDTLLLVVSLMAHLLLVVED